jgi:hypothetical protein
MTLVEWADDYVGHECSCDGKETCSWHEEYEQLYDIWKGVK